ncbi:Cof-type HAD-IIB family hydrolase [Microbacterium thalli]|uniref:Cof-type HAD-IIB family hydrolase n=1 Tax=Microbacterium thalli TaxID=3027921 RepID=A0ABT5SEN0_9MICO|nr:Cof-type HAD-IIB family hydrolase [Microbacterium thalli]MDD7961267.1 Cof-type HAD-IIB family hydrolase [Microbacterium thalli]MDN8550009.1 Cof-type HAD-IIB family hydrolase [Microbacterium thalli]
MTPSPVRRRAVFLDVDGTLLQDGTRLPPSAVAAVRRARENGHLVLLSTGRGMAELRGPILDIGFDGAVTNGGAFANVGDELIVSRLMSAPEIARLAQEFEARGIHWYFQSYDRLFASPGLPAVLADRLERDRLLHTQRARAAGLDPDELEFFSVGMKTFDDDIHFSDAEVAKAVILGDDAQAVADLLAELAPDFAVVSGTIPLPEGSSGEVAPRGVNKGAAILEVLAHLGVDPVDAIGIGDNWNDAEMFEVCGTSIAMGNAEPAVQALADEVTTAIDDDGIHHAFVRHGLI